MDLGFQELKERAREITITLLGFEPRDYRLEQIEKETDGNWNIVVSYLSENKNIPSTESILGFNKVLPYERIYKRLILDNEGSFLKLLMYNER